MTENTMLNIPVDGKQRGIHAVTPHSRIHAVMELPDHRNELGGTSKLSYDPPQPPTVRSTRVRRSAPDTYLARSKRVRTFHAPNMTAATMGDFDFFEFLALVWDPCQPR